MPSEAMAFIGTTILERHHDSLKRHLAADGADPSIRRNISEKGTVKIQAILDWHRRASPWFLPYSRTSDRREHKHQRDYWYDAQRPPYPSSFDVGCACAEAVKSPI